MLQKYIITLSLLLFFTVGFNQNNLTKTNLVYGNSFQKINQIENYIYKQQKDSALILLNSLNHKENNSYIKILFNIANNTYSNYDLSEFLKISLSTNVTDNKIKNNFINKKIKRPNQEHSIDINYVKVRFHQIVFLLNVNLIHQANSLFKTLKNYVSNHKEKTSIQINKETNYYINAIKIIYDIIESNIEEGEKLCDINTKIAYELKDTFLIALSGYNKAEFLINKRELESYITLMQKMINLEDNNKIKTPIYYLNLYNLINAKIYRQDDSDEVIGLIKKMYFNPRAKQMSYFLMIDQLRQLDNKHPFYNWTLNEFNCKNSLELSQKMLLEAEGKIFPNDYYQLMRVLANYLLKQKYYTEAFDLKEKSVGLIKKIYSEDLSKALAENKINEIEKQKEYELALEIENNKFLTLLLVSILFVLVLIIIGIIFTQKKNKILIKKKKQIEKKDFEKQLLLKEIHHRIKNNFQIITSLIELQIKGINDEKAIALAKESQNRIKSMALIHQKLYLNDDLSIPFKEYVTELVSDINSSYSNLVLDVNIIIDENYIIDIDTAIPLGLIINELVTNSCKYAFTDTTSNHLKIKLNKGKTEYQIIISDNGKGLPNTFEMNDSKSIGLKLVKNLAKQLHGSFSYEYRNGAVFTVSYKDISIRKLVD